MVNQKNYVLILTSGGIDSTACINFYKKMEFNVEGIFIDFGQVSRRKEFKAVKKIAEHYQIEVKRIKLQNMLQVAGGEILGRNAFLIFTAILNFQNPYGIIGIGINKGTQYYDCSSKFLVQTQALLDHYSHETIKVGAPFLNFSKRDIIDYCLDNDVPLHLTYSCENGRRQPCGECLTCKDLEVIYAGKK